MIHHSSQSSTQLASAERQWVWPCPFGKHMLELEITWTLAGFRLSFCGRPPSTNDHESNLFHFFPRLPLVSSQDKTSGATTIVRPIIPKVMAMSCPKINRLSYTIYCCTFLMLSPQIPHILAVRTSYSMRLTLVTPVQFVWLHEESPSLQSRSSWHARAPSLNETLLVWQGQV